jgi:adenylosuccinate lyase
VQPERVEALQAWVDQVDVERALEIEAEIHHDLMAELKTFAEQCPEGGGILHLGATSMDISDNAEALRVRDALDLILNKLQRFLEGFAERVQAWAEVPTMAYTHLQPAEPTTVGYRLAQYGQDFLMDWEALNRVFGKIRGKGFKGAVGTGASYGELIGLDQFSAFEERLSEELELPFFPVATQTYPRKQEYQIVSAVAGLGGSFYKFAFDLRIMQSPNFGEMNEAFRKKQVGSSAMPFKRNPIRAEKMNSLGRLLAQYPRLAWDNAAHSLLERTLDDSANRRTMLPEVFLIADELLRVGNQVIDGLELNRDAARRQMEAYGAFAATERVLMALVEAGADRQDMHEILRTYTLRAWESVQRGDPNPLVDLIVQAPEFNAYLSQEERQDLMDAGGYTGVASPRAHELAGHIQRSLQGGNVVE